MTIPFTCPYCGAVSQVAKEHAGRTGPCAHCGRAITVPTNTASSDADGAEFSPPTGGRTARLSIGLLVAGGVMFIVCVGVCGSVLTTIFRAYEENQRRELCAANLREIAAALDSHHTDYGCYPPAYIADSDGTPIHSWRALVLRYIDEELSEKYDFNEPWNSKKNQELAAKMPAAFGCRSNPESVENCTAFVAIVGPGYFFSGPQPTLQSQLNNPAATIAVVETAGHVPIHWLEPRDITVDELSDLVGDRAIPSISSNHIHGANVLMADGKVQYLPDDTPRTKIDAQLPIAAGT